MEESGRSVGIISRGDYESRRYLSATEAANFLGVKVKELHRLVREGVIPKTISASGQQRFDLKDLDHYGSRSPDISDVASGGVTAPPEDKAVFLVNGTGQQLFNRSSMMMTEMADESVHLVITSPPYFNTKMYAKEPIEGDLGNIHDVETWLAEIGKVWGDVYRVLQPGRKLFINIMNLPVRLENGGFRSINLVGRTIDVCESLGFVFKRDIIWHKTNGVRAQFGTYPYPGGILINNMHESILEFERPCPRDKRSKKYSHVTKEQREASRLNKEFWLSIKNTDVWLMKPQGSGDRRTHVAPFPLELPRRIIKAFSFKGETVLDPLMGSGTTLVAAAVLGRNGVGYDIDPDIFRKACDTVRSI